MFAKLRENDIAPEKKTFKSSNYPQNATQSPNNSIQYSQFNTSNHIKVYESFVCFSNGT